MPALDQPIELPDDLLGPPDRERRDEQDAVVRRRRAGRSRPGRGSTRPRARARGRRRSTRSGRSRRRSRPSGRAGSACRSGRGRRRRRDPLAGPPVPLGDPQPDDRRAEDVAGIDEGRVDARRDLDLGVVVDRPGTRPATPAASRRRRAARRGRCRGRRLGSQAAPRGRVGHRRRSGRLDARRDVLAATQRCRSARSSYGPARTVGGPSAAPAAASSTAAS